MKVHLSILIALLVLLAVGCGRAGETSAAEEQQMRDALAAGDEPFNIENVPPEHREKVRGFMGGQPPSGN